MKSVLPKSLIYIIIITFTIIHTHFSWVWDLEEVYSPYNFTTAPNRTNSQVRGLSKFSTQIIDILQYQYSLRVNVFLGTPPQKLSLKLSLSTPFIWLKNQTKNDYPGFNVSGSSTCSEYSNKTYDIPDTNYTAVNMQDVMSFGENIKIERFPFLLVANYSFKREIEITEPNFDGVLGLPVSIFEYSDNHLMFLDVLRSNSLIPSNKFYIDFSNIGNPKLILGSMPDEVTKNMKYLHQHRDVYPPVSFNKFSYYHVSLNAIYVKKWSENNNNDIKYGEFEKNYYPELFNVGENVLFSFENRVHQVSEKFYNMLINTYFAKAINNGVCSDVHIEAWKWRYINCNLSFNLVIDVKWVLMEWSYVLDNKYNWIIDNDAGEKVFTFVYSYQKVPVHWVIGIPFMQKYTTIFDNGRIDVYYKKE